MHVYKVCICIYIHNTWYIEESTSYKITFFLTVLSLPWIFAYLNLKPHPTPTHLSSRSVESCCMHEETILLTSVHYHQIKTTIPSCRICDHLKPSRPSPSAIFMLFSQNFLSLSRNKVPINYILISLFCLNLLKKCFYICYFYNI